MEDNKRNPFPDVVTADWSFLEDNASRTKCLKCNKSRKYYCYSCCIALPHIQDKLPKVKLPLKVDIIKHPKELDGKSTAPHASILAPEDVTIYTYPCIPDYNQHKVIIVFPGENSVSLDELKGVETETCQTSQVDDSLTNLQSRSKKDSEGTTENCSNNLYISRSEEDALKNNSNGNNKANISSTDIVNIHNNNTGREKNSPLSECSPLIPIAQTQLKFADDKPRMSQLESIEHLTRKRVLSKEDGDGIQEDNTVFDSECKDSTITVKHQKTHLRQCPFEKVVFVDCTWNQTKQIVNDERLKGLKKVELKTQFTHFWRSQEGMPKTYLSTIEAIYFFFKDFHSIFIDPIYRHEYDNLLMFFCFMYHKIKQAEAVELK